MDSTYHLQAHLVEWSMMLHVNDHMSRGLWVRILLVYIFSGLDGPDFSSKCDLMGFRADSVRTARTLHRLRTDSARTARTPHGLARTGTSPCGVRTDSVQSVRSAQGPVGHCKLLGQCQSWVGKPILFPNGSDQSLCHHNG